MSQLTKPKPAKRAIIGVDPDSAHTALCVLWSDGTVQLAGGGSTSAGRPLCSVVGARDVLVDIGPANLAGVWVETQAAKSQWSKACDPVRRSRYMWEAACELVGAPHSAVDPLTWQRWWVGTKAAQRRTSRVSSKGRGNATHPLRDAASAQSVERARLIGVKCANEDQRSALGIAAYGAHSLGWAMPWD